MKLELQTITPEIAKTLLENNKQNRPVSRDNVNFIKNQIAAGEWQVTGDPVKFSPSGVLLDGQHRLIAISEGECPVQIWVAHDVPEAVFTVLDTGKARTARDVVAMKGLPSATATAALARRILTLETGKLGKGRNMTNAQILRFCQNNDLVNYVNEATKWRSKGGCMVIGHGALCLYVLSQVDAKAAAIWMERVCLGIEIRAESAEYRLREKLTCVILGNGGLGCWEVLALTIKAWNLSRSHGKVPSILTYNPEKESFPKAI